MLDDRETPLFGNPVLATFDFRIVEFFDAPALQADQMIVVLAVVELEYRLARLEMMPFEQAGLFELGKDAINRRQTDIHALRQQQAVNVLGGEMAVFRLAEQVEDGHARDRGLEADTLEFCGIGHAD